MSAGRVFRRVIKKLFRKHGMVKCFEKEVKSAGGPLSGADAGTEAVDARKIVGSVGRSQSLRSDFFHRYGRAITGRYERVGQAMKEGKVLPPLELYRIRRSRAELNAESGSPPTEYYVLDGHHRVAMARKLGQDFLDAHVVEYRVGPESGTASEERSALDDTSGAPGAEKEAGE